MDDNAINEMVKNMFNDFDKDKNGFIDRTELKDVTKQFMAASVTSGEVVHEPTDEMINCTMEMLDTNKDGKISPEEMRDFLKSLFGAMEQAFGAL